MTKQSLIGNGCWALVAVAAFVIGSQRNGSSSSSEEAAGRSESSSSSRNASFRGGENPMKAAQRKIPRAKRSGSGGSDENSFEGLPFTEEELSALSLEAFKDGNPLVRRVAFGRLLESMTGENATTIRKFLLEHKVSGDQWRDFHYAWGGIDGAAALKSAAKSQERDLDFSMAGFAAAYPEAARQFIDNLPKEVGTSGERLRSSLIAGVADSNPELATQMVLDYMAQGDQRASQYMGQVASEILSTQSIQEAAGWSEALPDGDLKGAAMDQVANRFTNQDPEAAAAWAEQFAGESYAARVIEEVGDEWAERNPKAAIDWLESLPEGEGQNTGLRSAYGEWARRDPVAAGEQLAAMPRSEQRDYAINGYANMLAYRDPNMAIDWANSIADDGLRNSALTRAGQQLFRRDPDAARTWVAGSGLSPEAQQAVLNPQRRR